jgi:hypothetical protein
MALDGPTTNDQFKDFMLRNIEPLNKAYDPAGDILLNAIPVLSDAGGTGSRAGGEYLLTEQRFKDALPWTYGGRMAKGKHPRANKVAYGPDDAWVTCEVEYEAAMAGRLSNQLSPITDQLMEQFRDCEQVLKIGTAEEVMLDGTGRRARLVSIENATYADSELGTINVSKVCLDPFLCHKRNAGDAVKYIHKYQSVDVISWDEAAWTGAVVANGTDDEGYMVVYIDESTTASESYVYLYPRLPAEGPAAGHFLSANGFCGQDKTEAAGLACQGLFAQLGKGTVMGSYGAGTHVCCLGSPHYGTYKDITVDRLTDSNFEFFTGACYNDSPYMAATDLTEITLDDSVMLDAFLWHRKHSLASTGVESKIDLLLVTTEVWKAYAMAGKDRSSLFSTTPMSFNLGIGAREFTFDAPFYNYKGRNIPLLIMDYPLPAQTMLGLDFATLARAILWAGWDPTAQHPDFPFFTRMNKLGMGDFLRAVYDRKAKFVNKFPSALLSLHNIAAYSPAGS